MPDPLNAAAEAKPADPLPPDPRPGAGANLLFLREEQIRVTQEMLFFAYRDITAAADAILAELNLGRAHHRALLFIGRNPGISVGDLLAILQITKQSLARVLTPLIAAGYVRQESGLSDRRQRLLFLTDQGNALERGLFERQRERLVAAYREAGGQAVEGFRRVLRGIMNEAARNYIAHGEATSGRGQRAGAPRDDPGRGKT